jgi:hypothetical protein
MGFDFDCFENSSTRLTTNDDRPANQLNAFDILTESSIKGGRRVSSSPDKILERSVQGDEHAQALDKIRKEIEQSSSRSCNSDGEHPPVLRSGTDKAHAPNYNQLETEARVALLEERAKSGPFSMAVAQRLIRLGDACDMQNKGNESENYYKQAERIAEKNDRDPQAAYLLRRLASREEQNGHNDEAESLRAKAREIRANVYEQRK